MRALLAITWPLLLGCAFMMLGNGLQGSLLGLRATIEGFPSALTGLVMSAYFAGFFLGAYLVPRIVRRVGHVRVFAALIALASIANLVQAAFVTWPVWTVMRAATGFSFIGLYIVCESWLNGLTPNETRGRLLSFYMAVQFGAVTASQLLLNLASPAGYELFVLVSALLTAAILPVVLMAGATPRYDAPSHIGLLGLYRASPLAVVSMLGVGMTTSVFAGMAAVYAKQLDLPDLEISLFLTVGMLGAALGQWPLGRVSDRLPRRHVLLFATLAAAAVAALAATLAGSAFETLCLLAFLFGLLSPPLYSICCAIANDRLQPDQMVAASSGLILCYGIGAITGPLTVGAVMSGFGPGGFFAYLAIVHAAVGAFAIYRIVSRPAGAAHPAASSGTD
jgi:MFS family permease